MKKYLRVEIGSRGEMDCLIIDSSIDILNKKVERIRREFEENECLDEYDEVLCLNVSKDEKLVFLGLNGEESEIYIRGDYKRYDEVLELWNRGKIEEFEELVYEFEMEIYE